MADNTSHNTEPIKAIIESDVENVTEGVEATKTPPPEERKSKIKTVRYWLMLNLGVFLISFGIYMFEAPNNFLMGGVAGISILLSNVINVSWLTYDVYLWVINIILAIIGFIFLGKGLGIKTVYCFLMYNIEVTLMTRLFPLSGPISGGDGSAWMMLDAIFAVIVAGIGQAIIFYCGSTSGGTDIIAMIVKKYSKINISFAIIAVDFVIATLSFFPSLGAGFGAKMGLMCILGVTIRAFAIDGIIENAAKTKYVTIITSNPSIAANVIINELDRSYTRYKAEGGYTGEERTIIITVCRRSQAIQLKEKLQKDDPTAFTIITDANEIIGDGFAKKF